MPLPFPQLAPPDPDLPDLTPPDPARKARAKTRALPSLPWGETLIFLAIGLILLQV